MPANLRIIYDNVADTGTLVASSQTALLTAANLRSERKAMVWRTAAGVTAATLTLTLTGERIISGVVLAFSNLTTEATMRVTTRAAGVVTGDTGARLCCRYQPLGLWGWGVQPLGVNGFAYGLAPYGVVWLDAPVNADQVTIDVADAGNPAGYVEASRLIVGSHWSPTYNATYGASWGLVERPRSERNESGDLVAEVAPRRRRISVDLARLPPADRLQLVGMLQQVGTARPFFFSLFPGRLDDPALEQNYQLWGHLPDAVELQHRAFRAHSAALTIEEM